MFWHTNAAILFELKVLVHTHKYILCFYQELKIDHAKGIKKDFKVSFVCLINFYLSLNIQMNPKKASFSDILKLQT